VRQTRRVSNQELRQRAAGLGVSVSYWDWRGHEVSVPDETLAAIVAALEDAPAPGGGFTPPQAAAPWPAQRSWGFAVQLYSLRSRGSWGHGDLRDLADLAGTWAPASPSSTRCMPPSRFPRSARRLTCR
jgi:hypothetical protein